MSALQIHIQNKINCSQPFPAVLFLSVPPPPRSLQTPAPPRGQCRWNFWSRRPRRPACCSQCHFLSCRRSSASRAASSRGGTCSASPWTSARYFWQKHPPFPPCPSLLPLVLLMSSDLRLSFLPPGGRGEALVASRSRRETRLPSRRQRPAGL